MTTVMTNEDAGFDANAWLYDVPVTSGLVALAFSNQNLVKLGKNMATGELFPAVIGQPTVNAGYAEFFGGLKYIDTGVVETDAISIMVVCKTPDTSIVSPLRPTFVGNTSGSAFSIEDPARLSPGCAFYALSDTQVTWAATRHIISGDTISASNWTLTVPNVSSWSCYSCRADDTRQTLKDLTRSLSNVSAVAGGRPRFPAQGGIRIGSAGSGSLNSGNEHVAIVAIYSRYISDAEETENYLNFKAYMDDVKSITI